MAEELPLGLPPLPAGLDRLVEASDRPGVRIGERDGLVRDAGGRIVADGARVLDEDGLTELERRFVDELMQLDAETQEPVDPTLAWVRAGGSEDSARTSSRQALAKPRVMAAIQRRAPALVWSMGLPQLVLRCGELVLRREIERQERAGALFPGPSRGALGWAALLVGLSGARPADRVEHDHNHHGSVDIVERLERARARAEERRRQPVLELEAEPAEGGG